MPSPFPGMNPWLEQDHLWPDVHNGLLGAIKERLVAQVRPKYVVLFEQHVYLHEPPFESPRLMGRADVSVAEPRRGGVALAEATEVEAPAEVDLVEVDLDIERVPYLEIRDRLDRTLITVIELLSPSNKKGEDRRRYLLKRRHVLSGGAHFVEIDLLRGGEPMPLAHRPACSYSVLVSRSETRPRAGFWPIGLRDRLPEIPIPLRHPDPNARLDLQETLHHVYDVFGYEDFIYTGAPDPPLSDKDAAWAKTLVPTSP